MKANREGKRFYEEQIKGMLKRLSFEQLKVLYQFIRGMIE
jgi:hypothetical protein